MQQPTLRDVAAAAGVHPATASRALNPQTRRLVNADTARRVQRIAESMGFQPNPFAQSLKSARSGTVGIVLPDITNPLFPPIVRGIDEVLGPAGYSALIVNTDNDPDRERAQIRSLRFRHVEGVISATARLDDPLLEQLREQGLSLVTVNRRSADTAIPAVTPDDAQGVELAVRHLVELGHRRILHLAGPQGTSTGVARMRGFRSAVAELGLHDDPALVVTCRQWSEAEGARCLREALDAGTEFTAVVAGNDLIALGCYDVIEERALRCPADVSVVGFNDMPLLDKLRPPMTTVAIPHHQLGEEAARMLLESIGRPDRPARSVVLPVSLVVRGSTAPPPA